MQRLKYLRYTRKGQRRPLLINPVCGKRNQAAWSVYLPQYLFLAYNDGAIRTFLATSKDVDKEARPFLRKLASENPYRKTP